METITTIWKGFKIFMGRDWSRTEKMLMLLNFMFVGMILGFFIASIRKGIGNNNGNSYRTNYGDVAAEEEYWLDDED